MDFKAAALLEKLDQAKPWSPISMRTDFERKTARWSRNLLFAAFLCLVVVPLPFLAWKRYFGPLHGFNLYFPLSSIALSVVLVLLALVIDCLPAVPLIVKHKEYCSRSLSLEIEHNAKIAKQLVSFGRHALREVDANLKAVYERWKPVADVATVLSALGTFQSSFSTIKDLTGYGSSLWLPMWLGHAFIAGLLIGAIAMSKRLSQYNYQRSLISIALEDKSISD